MVHKQKTEKAKILRRMSMEAKKIKPKEKYFTPNFNHKTKLETT